MKILILTSWFFSFSAIDTKSIESQIMCMCGCSMVLVNCTCEDAIKTRADIQKMLEAGKTDTQVIAHYVSVFGESVLAAPKKTGFGSLSYILPVVGFILGGGLVYLLLRRPKRSKGSRMLPVTPKIPVDSDLEKRIQKELEEL